MIPDNFIDGSAFSPTRGIKRHNKRRIVQVPFAELVLSKLKLGGAFHMATDQKRMRNTCLKSCLLSTGTKIRQSIRLCTAPGIAPGVTKF